MNHLEEWEKKGGKLTLNERGPRNSPVQGGSLVCEVCNKVCKSKGGLTNHVKRMHNVSTQKVMFKCDACNKEFSQEANLKNHCKKCVGEEEEARVYVPRDKQCEICGQWKSASNLSRHRRVCQGGV